MGKSGTCKIGNWCVCQWAFSRYLERAGGCDSVVDLVCDATNQAAFDAYVRSDRPADRAALDCIKKRCGFFKDVEDNASSLSQPDVSAISIVESDANSSIAHTKGALKENASCKVQDKSEKVVFLDDGSCSS